MQKQTITFRNVDEMQAVSSKYLNATDSLSFREYRNSLQAVGLPRELTELPEGAILLCVDIRDTMERFIIAVGRNVYLWGERVAESHDDLTVLNTLITTVDAIPVDAVAIGQFLVIRCTDGLHFLSFSEGVYASVDCENKFMTLRFGKGEEYTVSAPVPQIEFATPYSSWQSPLAPKDVKALTAQHYEAYKAASAIIARNRTFSQPIAVRYAVRLWDDSIMYVSSPVILGDSLQGVDAVLRDTITADGAYIGLAESEMELTGYAVSIKGSGEFDYNFKKLIKSVDILYSELRSSPIFTDAITYHCNSSLNGATKYTLSATLAHRSAKDVAIDLANSDKWHIIARITDIDRLGEELILYRSDNELYNAISSEQLSRVTKFSTSVVAAAGMAENNGRLYMWGGNSRYINNWNLLSSACVVDENVPCNVCVTAMLKSDNGQERTVVTTSYFPHTPLSLSPLLTVPFPDAMSVKVDILSQGNHTSLSCLLEPDVSGAFSYCVSDDLSPFALVADENEYVVPAESNNKEYRGNKVAATYIGNPFALYTSQIVGDTDIRDVAFALHPVTANIFGRYPMYVFSSRGVYAVSTEKTTIEPRLIDSHPINYGTLATWSDFGLLYLSGETLFSIMGAEAIDLHKSNGCVEMLWNDAFNELWCRCTDNSTYVMQSNRRTYRRQEQVKCLVRNSHYAITEGGRLIDLSEELSGDVEVYFLSDSFATGYSVRYITWSIFGTKMEIAAAINGESGDSCHGVMINRIRLSGNLNVPVTLPIVPIPYRSVRFEVRGTVSSGTLLSPVIIM